MRFLQLQRLTYNPNTISVELTTFRQLNSLTVLLERDERVDLTQLTRFQALTQLHIGRESNNLHYGDVLQSSLKCIKELRSLRALSLGDKHEAHMGPRYELRSVRLDDADWLLRTAPVALVSLQLDCTKAPSHWRRDENPDIFASLYEGGMSDFGPLTRLAGPTELVTVIQGKRSAVSWQLYPSSLDW